MPQARCMFCFISEAETVLLSAPGWGQSCRHTLVYVVELAHAGVCCRAGTSQRWTSRKSLARGRCKRVVREGPHNGRPSRKAESISSDCLGLYWGTVCPAPITVAYVNLPPLPSPPAPSAAWKLFT